MESIMSAKSITRRNDNFVIKMLLRVHGIYSVNDNSNNFTWIVQKIFETNDFQMFKFIYKNIEIRHDMWKPNLNIKNILLDKYNPIVDKEYMLWNLLIALSICPVRLFHDTFCKMVDTIEHDVTDVRPINIKFNIHGLNLLLLFSNMDDYIYEHNHGNLDFDESIDTDYNSALNNIINDVLSIDIYVLNNILENLTYKISEVIDLNTYITNFYDNICLKIINKHKAITFWKNMGELHKELNIMINHIRYKPEGIRYHEVKNHWAKMLYV